MKRLVHYKTEPLTDEERAIFSIAFKNVSGERRAAWRRIYSIERQEMQHCDDLLQNASENSKEVVQALEHRIAIVRHYKAHIEEELTYICSQVVILLLVVT